MTKAQKIIIVSLSIILFVLVVFLILRLRKPTEEEKKADLLPVGLTVWQLFDEPSVYQPIIDRYRESRPNVSITVQKKNFQSYEIELLNSLAEGRGPDIFYVRSDSTKSFANKLDPLPDSVMTREEFEKTFVQATAKDLSARVGEDRSDRLFGLPQASESLALFYNRDLLALAEKTSPPTTWDELILISNRIKRFQGAAIAQAGLAFGRADNVVSAADILQLLMLQNRTPMVSSDGLSAALSKEIPAETGDLVKPGVLALDFFTGFSRPGFLLEIDRRPVEVYSWSAALPSSIEAFGQGRAGFMLGYSYHINQLRNLSPSLNFSVALAPQIEAGVERVDYGRYYFFGVSKEAQNRDEAWRFLKFLTDYDQAKLYHSGSKRPPARLDLTDELASESLYGPFALQAKSLKTWFRPEGGAVDRIFSQMIQTVVDQGKTANISIDTANSQLTELLSRFR